MDCLSILLIWWREASRKQPLYNDPTQSCSNLDHEWHDNPFCLVREATGLVVYCRRQSGCFGGRQLTGLSDVASDAASTGELTSVTNSCTCPPVSFGSVLTSFLLFSGSLSLGSTSLYCPLCAHRGLLGKAMCVVLPETSLKEDRLLCFEQDRLL